MKLNKKTSLFLATLLAIQTMNIPGAKAVDRVSYSEVIFQENVRSLAEPLIMALKQMEKLASSDSKLKREARNIFYRSVDSFGDNLEIIAKNNPPSVAREYLLFALENLKDADKNGILNNEAQAKFFEKEINQEIQRRARLVHPIVAVASGIVVGFVVGALVGRVAVPAPKSTHPMDPATYKGLGTIMVMLFGGAAGGGTLFYYLNKNSDFNPEEIRARINADQDLYNL